MAQAADIYPDGEQSGDGAAPAAAMDAALNTARTPGEALRLRREHLGLTLAQVHATLRIRVEYLQALENQHFALIPSQGYVKAWLRKYAQFLKLDPDQVVARFQAENAVCEDTPVATVQVGKRSIGAKGKISALAVGLLLVAGGWFAAPAVLRKVAPPKKEAPVFVMEDGAAAGIGVSPVVVADNVLTIRARERAWLEVRGPDGTIFLSRELAAGESYEPAAAPGWTVFAKNGGAFEVYGGGRFIGLLGEPGIEVQAYRLEEAVKTAQADAAAEQAAQQASDQAAAQAVATRAALVAAPRPATPQPVAVVTPAVQPAIAAPAPKPVFAGKPTGAMPVPPRPQSDPAQ